jgi:hypothetical protein
VEPTGFNVFHFWRIRTEDPRLSPRHPAMKHGYPDKAGPTIFQDDCTKQRFYFLFITIVFCFFFFKAVKLIIETDFKFKIKIILKVEIVSHINQFSSVISWWAVLMIL